MSSQSCEVLAPPGSPLCAPKVKLGSIWPLHTPLRLRLTFGFSSLITRTVVPFGENMSRLCSRSAMLSCHQATTTSFGRCLIGSGLLAMPATGAGLNLSASKAVAGRGACLTGLKKPAGAYADRGHRLQLELGQLLDGVKFPCRSKANRSAQAVAGYWTACLAGLHEQILVTKARSIAKSRSRSGQAAAGLAWQA